MSTTVYYFPLEVAVDVGYFVDSLHQEHRGYRFVLDDEVIGYAELRPFPFQADPDEPFTGYFTYDDEAHFFNVFENLPEAILSLVVAPPFAPKPYWPAYDTNRRPPRAAEGVEAGTVVPLTKADVNRRRPAA